MLMDVRTPKMDGVTALHEIRRHDQKVDRPDPPIVAVTAEALAKVVALSRRAA